MIPPEGALVEVTVRTVQARFLLTPSPELNEIIPGVLGRAQSRYKVGICAFVFLSGHYHLLLKVQDAKQLSDFMGYFNSNLAREVARLADWHDKIWARRYQAIVISDEEGAQIERLNYLLSHGCKEGLVEHLRDWPGVHCVRPLLDGEPVVGVWFDRTQEYWARQRREPIAPRQFATEETVTLEPLPCWSHLSADAVRQRVAELVEGIEAKAAAKREETQRPALGAAAVCAQLRHHRPAQPKKSPAPRFHAFTRRVRRELYQLYRSFVQAFREAAEKLRSGDRNARFPVGSFPPGLPFVTAL